MIHPRPKTVGRESATLTAVADALDRLLESRCPRPSRLWQLAAGADSSPDELRHILTCGACRGRASQVAEAAGDPPAAWAALPAAAVRTRVARQQLSPLAGELRLDFEADPHLEASCGPDPVGVHWLGLRHRLLPPGLPFVVVLEAPGGERPWVRHAMLRVGAGHAAARVQIGEAFAAGGERQVRVEGIDLEDIPFLTAAVLRESVEAARRDDPAAVPHWQTWAREALTLTGLPARLREGLEGIARG
jgi:hypothetical protein